MSTNTARLPMDGRTVGPVSMKDLKLSHSLIAKFYPLNHPRMSRILPLDLECVCNVFGIIMNSENIYEIYEIYKKT